MSDDTTSLAADLSAAMSDTSAHDAPAAPTTTVETPAPQGPATTVPAASPAAGIAEANQGPIPFKVHHTALENARAKTRSEVEAEWADYAWMKQVPPEDLRQTVDSILAMHQDFGGFLESRLVEHPQAVEIAQRLVHALQQHPTHGQGITSLVARALRSSPGPAPDLDMNPDVDVFDAQGNVTGGAFSAPKVLALIKHEVGTALQQLRQELQPVVQTTVQVRQAEQARQQEFDVQQFTSTSMQDIATWPGMSDAEADKPNRQAVGTRVKEIMASLVRTVPREVAHNTDWYKAQLLNATNRAWRELVQPKFVQASYAQAIHDLNTKAQVNTASPHAPSSGTPQSYDQLSLSEALQQEWNARVAR